MSIITLTTDFGNGSPYAAAMKGVILSINPAAVVVDITHAVPPQDVREGSIILAETTGWFPQGTIHVAVIDPGVGTERAIVYARIAAQQYVLPDNGLLSRLVEEHRPEQLVRIENSEHWLPEVSSTFHGRDIMAPVAARLSLGLSPEKLGPPADEVIALPWPRVRETATRIEGQVLRSDSFGNLITNIPAEMLAGRPTDTRVCIVCHIYETWGVYSTYAEQPSDALIALVGSSGHVELALVGGNAAKRLGIPIGVPVVLSWD